MSVNSVGHKVEFTIRGNERDAAFAIKLVEPDALMELYVLHLD